ncbi:MAG TPA: glycosyltransferase [Bacteroidales bacterium]|nr:glycosyltransferase [Bacteroidales bacterium]
MFGYTLDTLDITLLSVLLLSSLIQLFYYFRYYIKVVLQSPRRETGRKKPVSVIICARNEAENLKEFLPSVLEQDYPEFEAIVVNDCSEDNTTEILTSFLENYSNLRVTTIHKDSSLGHSKKMALFIGIKAASYDHLLLTDADCKPASNKWMGLMMSGYSGEKEFVLGYGGYLKKRGLLNKYIRYDAMFIALQYTGMALAGRPYMGVGRNLAYKKSLFFDNKGFGPHLNLQSGDDDLFVNALANKDNTSVVIDKNAYTLSLPSTRWISFSKQKMRHMSTSVYYRPSTKFLLGLEPVSRLINYVLFFYLISQLTIWPVTVAIFGITLISKLTILFFAQKSLNERDLLLFSPLFDIASLFLNGCFLIGARKNKYQSYEWK